MLSGQNFNRDPDWVTAQTKVVNAQADLDTAKQAANDALVNNPDYQAAVAAKKKAVDDLAAAKAGDDATPETLGPLAERITEGHIEPEPDHQFGSGQRYRCSDRYGESGDCPARCGYVEDEVSS